MSLNSYVRVASIVAACAFAVAVAVVLMRHSDSRAEKLLAAQYAFLLPALAGFLWAYRATEESADRTGAETSLSPVKRVRLPPVKALLIFYLIVAVPLAWWSNQVTSSGDESAYRFQARIFASGRLTAEAPTRETVDNNNANEFFFIHHIIARGQWFGKYPPGWPALLAVGTLLGIEWLVNPLLGALLLWLVYRIGRFCFDESIARLATLLLLLSPMFFINCFGYYSHVTCAILLLVSTLLCLRSMRQWRAREVALCFLTLGVAFLVRPFTSFCFATVLGLSALVGAWPHARRLGWVMLWGSLGAAVAAGGLMAYNYATTGDPLRSAYAMYRGTASAVEIGVTPESLWNNLRLLTSRALVKTDLALFPFMFLLAAYACLKPRERAREIYLLAALALCTIVGHVVMTEESDTVVGERYYFESLFALALLTARGWSLISERWRFSTGGLRAAAIALAAVACLHFGVFAHDLYRRKAPFAQVRQAIEKSGVRDGLVFMRVGQRFQAKDFNLNEADWRQAERFYLVDPGEGRRAAVAEVLGKDKWYVFAYENGRAVLEERADELSGAPAPPTPERSPARETRP